MRAYEVPLLPCGAAQTATDYGPYIQNLPSPLHTTSIVEACTQLLVDQWHYLRANVRFNMFLSARPLSQNSMLCFPRHRCAVSGKAVLGTVAHRNIMNEGHCKLPVAHGMPIVLDTP
jgi:hypothetical protein